MAIPRLDLFTGLIGGVCISTLSTLIPATMYMLVHYGEFGKFKWRLILGVTLFCTALIVTACAVVTNLVLIINFLRYGYIYYYIII